MGDDSIGGIPGDTPAKALIRRLTDGRKEAVEYVEDLCSGDVRLCDCSPHEIVRWFDLALASARVVVSENAVADG